MRNAVVVLVVVAGLAGCSSSEPPPSVGDGLAREVATAEGAMTSVSALVYGQAVAGLHDQPAVHTDFRLTVAGRDSTGSLELDVASGSFGAAVETEGADVEVIVADGEHFRLEGAGGDWIHQADDVALSVARVLGFATFADLGLSEIGDLIVDPGSHPQSLDTRLGSYGFEEGHRLVNGEVSVEFWVSQDTGLLTVVAVEDLDGVTGEIAYTPLPAPLVIARPGQ